jgi:hypothetical protein
MPGVRGCGLDLVVARDGAGGQVDRLPRVHRDGAHGPKGSKAPEARRRWLIC